MVSVRSLACLLALETAIGSAACSGKTATADAAPDSPPEDFWLEAVGAGPAQTARVCARGAKDRVANALCDASRPPIRSLSDLYRALQLDQPERRFVATTTHSLGLSARTVSGANPRVIVGPKLLPGEKFSYDQIASVGFSRGQQLVELVGLDPSTYEYHFYLLHFRQACSEARCAPEDLLTERLENDWTEWTLYADQDLEDTPLDCLTCHLPFGPGSHKLLQMRQSIDPWMHWSDFRTGTETLCAQAPTALPARIIATSRALDPLLTLEGPTGRYASVPVQELRAAESGSLLTNFLIDAELLIQASPAPPYPYAQLDFQTREVLCERFYLGTSPTWDQRRQEALARGLPVPFYGPDVFDPDEHLELMADPTAFLRTHASSDAFEVASALLGEGVAPAVGFVPLAEQSAPEILRSMCVRCHAADTAPNLRRARFNAEALETFEPDVARAIRTRITLRKTSPEIMPPRQAGELPAWAVERIDSYVREHCTLPGACE